MGKELMFSVALQVISIAFFAGIYVATVRFQRELIEKLEKNFEKSIEEIKQNFHEKFEILDKKQDKHNNIIERTYCSERDISVIKEQIKVGNHRIEDLEKKYAHIE